MTEAPDGSEKLNKCFHCSAPVTQPKTGRYRKFCSDLCRIRHNRAGKLEKRIEVSLWEWRLYLTELNEYRKMGGAGSVSAKYELQRLKRKADKEKKRLKAMGVPVKKESPAVEAEIAPKVISFSRLPDGSIPPCPVREDFEEPFDYVAAKNIWKRQFGK